MFEDKSQEKVSIADLGEFGLIERLTKDSTINANNTTKGVGDDAAVIENTNEQTVVSTDLLIEGVHFDLSYVPLKHLGYKSVVVNLSDIYAMNAHPTQITMSVALSNRFPVEALDEFYAGVHLACKQYGVDLVGGDTSSSLTGFMISVTAIGQVETNKIAYRNLAEDKDLLVVSGDLGAAYMGLQLLEREKEVFKVNPNMQPELNENDAYLLERQLKPEARKDIIELLKELDVQPKAMIDISDGLSSEIIHLCDQSEVGCKIYENKIPMDPAVIRLAEEFNMHPLTAALDGGEDYELLFTVPMTDFEKIKGNPNLSIIGHILPKEEGTHIITNSNELLPIIAQGFNQMKDKE